MKGKLGGGSKSQFMIWTLESVSPRCVEEGNTDRTTIFMHQSQQEMFLYSLVSPSLQQHISEQFCKWHKTLMMLNNDALSYWQHKTQQKSALSEQLYFMSLRLTMGLNRGMQ